MHLKQKQNADRPWLRQELLVVTKHLASLLEASNLFENEKRLRALVHHIIVRDSEIGGSSLLSVGSTRFQDGVAAWRFLTPTEIDPRDRRQLPRWP